MKKMKTIALVCALAIAGAMTARGVVIFDDQFSSGTRTGAGYYISNTNNGANGTVTGGFLVWGKSSGGSDPSVVWKNFTSYDLSAQPNGYFLRLNLGVTFDTIPTQNNGFRVGLYDFNGVRTTDATGANPPELRSSLGYSFQVGQTTSASQSRLVEYVGDTNGPAGSNSGTSTNLAFGNAFKVSVGDTRYYWLEITKNGTSYDVAWLYNTTSNDRASASTAWSVNDPSPVTPTFDGVALTIVNAGEASYSIDFITLEAIPEPGSMSLVAVVGGGLVLLRRRLRK